jgi:ribosomal protein S18 acetylase RimI-like enzyme
MSEVRQATRQDLDAVSTLLSTAFRDDPLLLYMLGGWSERRSRLAFRMLTGNMLGKGIVLVSSDLSSAALWAPPGKWRLGLPAMARTLPSTLAAYRWHIFRVLLALVRMERVQPRTPHYFLQVIGTEPSRRGVGIGSRLVEPVLAMADRDRVGAYLASSKDTNLNFYRRFGFEVVGKIKHIRGPVMRLMWRNPS